MARYIVNDGGATHSVGDEDFDRVLAANPRFREATEEEAAAWRAAYEPTGKRSSKATETAED